MKNYFTISKRGLMVKERRPESFVDWWKLVLRLDGRTQGTPLQRVSYVQRLYVYIVIIYFFSRRVNK